MRAQRNFTVAIMIGCMAAVFPQSGSAGTISRDTLSRKFLDYCVFTQYKAETVDRNTMINKCQCASKTAITGLEGQAFDSPSASRLTSDQEGRIRAAITSCFAGK